MIVEKTSGRSDTALVLILDAFTLDIIVEKEISLYTSDDPFSEESSEDEKSHADSKCSRVCSQTAHRIPKIT